jgi:glucose/mannose-6-phosphate isomerase
VAPLDAAAVAALDTTGQLREVLDLPEHLEDALWRVDSAGIQRGVSEGIVLVGVGGTAAGARIAKAALGDRERAPVLVADDGVLPPWVSGDWTVLLTSYSGTTPEVLAGWDAATRAGARRLVCSTGGELVERARAAKVPVIPVPGGFRPRHAIGYTAVVALEAARLAGAAAPLQDEVTAAARAIGELRASWDADGPEDADPKALARAIAGAVPVITGAGPTVAAAHRLKAQVNVNAGRPAFWSALPEAAHDERHGQAADLPVVGVHLVDPEATEPALLAGFDALDAALGGGAVRVEATGASRFERLMRLVHLGDLASLYLAVLEGTDPGRG